MDFDKWYDEQWIKIYHPRFHELESGASSTSTLLGLLKKDLDTLTDNFRTHRKDMYGNGEKGFVKRVVDEATNDLKEDLKQIIKDAFLEEYKKGREKWDTRTWAVVLIGIGLVVERVAEKLWPIMFP